MTGFTGGIGYTPLNGGSGGGTDYQEYPTLADFPAVGQYGVIYIALDTGFQYMWSGTQYNILTGSAVWGSITGILSNQTDLQNALNLKAPLASPSLTGVPTSITPTSSDNSTKIATTAYVNNNLNVGTPIIPVNTAIVANDTINVFANKTQGQFNAATNIPTPDTLMRYDANGNNTVNALGVQSVQYDLTALQVGGVVNINLANNSPGNITIFQTDGTNYTVNLYLPDVEGLLQDNGVTYIITNESFSLINVFNFEEDIEGQPIPLEWIGTYIEFENDWDVQITPTINSNLTTQGNSFNGANQLVQLNGSTQLPAVDSSLTTIGALTLTNTALANNDAEGVAFGKVQGQINAIISEVISPNVRIVAAGTMVSILPTDIIIRISGGTGITLIELPNATTIPQFTEYQIIEDSGNSVMIKDGSGAMIQNLLPYWQINEILEVTGTAGGSWSGNPVPTQKAPANTLFGGLIPQAITTNTVLTNYGIVAEVTATSSSIIITLPQATGAIPSTIRIIKMDSTANQVVTAVTAGNTVNGDASGGITLLVKNHYVDYQCDGTSEWKIVATNVTFAATTYVSANGNDLTAQPYSLFNPYSTVQAAADTMVLGDVLQIESNDVGYGDLSLDATPFVQINGLGNNAQIGNLTISDQNNGGIEDSINNLVINGTLTVNNYKDTIQDNIFTNSSIAAILLDNTSSSTSGFAGGSIYNICSILGDVNYLPTGYAKQTRSLQENYYQCQFSNSNTLTLNGDNINPRLMGCYPLPNIVCANGALTNQIYLNNYPNIQTSDYTLALNDNDGTIDFIVSSVMLTIDITKICPNFRVIVNCYTGTSVTMQNNASVSLGQLYGGQSALIYIDYNLNIHISVLSANKVQNYQLISVSNSIALTPNYSPVIYATGNGIIYLPSSASNPLPGQIFSIYNQGSSLLTIVDQNTLYILANLSPNANDAVQFTRNSDNTAWLAGASIGGDITLSSNQIFTFGNADSGDWLLNITGNSTRINLQNSVGAPYNGQVLKLSNLSTSSGTANIYLTSTGLSWATIAPNSALYACYNNGNWGVLSSPVSQTSGTWIPTDGSMSSLTFAAVSNAQYTVTGNVVQVQANILYPTTIGDTNQAIIASIPVGTTGSNAVEFSINTGGAVGMVSGALTGTAITLINPVGGIITNAQLSGLKVTLCFSYIP